MFKFSFQNLHFIRAVRTDHKPNEVTFGLKNMKHQTDQNSIILLFLFWIIDKRLILKSWTIIKNHNAIKKLYNHFEKVTQVFVQESKWCISLKV